ncbi:helix-turn-helix transcriptional regulator [Candidatus Falkowbacteria bacterium]|nr:helix-turn-helix transcriptional regulator [Candidatus Falkowbacteria bacterium]
MLPKTRAGISTSCRHRNQWRLIRKLRGFTQRQVARCIGHLNVDYYRDIESGKRIPSGRLLARLLCLLHCSLHQAYPWLVWEAEDFVETRLRASPMKKSPPPWGQKARCQSMALTPTAKE